MSLGSVAMETSTWGWPCSVLWANILLTNKDGDLGELEGNVIYRTCVLLQI
jgi:hypothetical protein